MKVAFSSINRSGTHGLGTVSLFSMLPIQTCQLKKGYPQAHREVNADSRAVCPFKAQTKKRWDAELAGNRRLDGQFRFTPLLRQRPGRLNINV